MMGPCWEPLSPLRLLSMSDPYVGILVAFKAIKHVGSLYLESSLPLRILNMLDPYEKNPCRL